VPGSMKQHQELTTEDVKAFLIQPLEAASVLLKEGPNIFDSPTGDPLRIPKLEAEPDEEDLDWFGENEEISEVEPDFDELVLLPTNLKSVKTLHRFSNELARHAIVPIGSVLQARLVQKVAARMDQQLFTGAGTVDGNGNRLPVGLLNQPGIQTGTFTSATPADLVDSSVDAIGAFITSEITDLSKVVWYMNSQDYVDLLKVKDDDGHGFLVPDATQPGNYTLQGIRVVPTSRIESATQLLVDMNMVAVGRDLAPSVKLLDQTFANFDQLAIRVVARMDIGLMHAEGVIKLTSS
jgi:HK97 family phage major capsid protein